MSDAARYSVALALSSAALLTIVLHRPEKQPGNLAPIQIITALGAWSLIVVNSVLAGIACAAGSALAAVAPVATNLCAAVLFVRTGRSGRSTLVVPESVQRVIDEIRSLLGGARSLGLDRLDAVLVGRGPRIGVSMPARGRVVVTVHEGLVGWFDRHQRRGGAGSATIGSFIRFAVLHELGHILNGDHRTYRFARSVIVAHLCWLVCGITVPILLVRRDVLAATMLIDGAAFIALVVTMQSLLARRFIAERERWADWRAMQSLSAHDSARLHSRSDMSLDRRAPAEIEKLMNDLKAEPIQDSEMTLFSRVVCWLWPEGDSVQRRIAALDADRAGAPPRPLLWAALSGAQCGLLAISVGVAVVLIVGGLSDTPMFWTLLTVMSWIAGPAGTYSVLRSDPAQMSVDRALRKPPRFATGAVFVVTFSVSAWATHLAVRGLGIDAWASGVAVAATVAVTAFLIAMCATLGGLIHGGDGGGSFRVAPREPRVFTVPVLSAFAIALFPLNMLVAYCFGLGHPAQGAWVAIMLCSLGAYVLSTVMVRSPNAFLRALAPAGVIASPAPIYRYRCFWWEFSVDITRSSLNRAALNVMAAQLSTLGVMVTAFSFAMHRVEQLVGLRPAFQLFYQLALAFFLLVILVPDRSQNLRRETLGLIERSRLEMFLTLLGCAGYANAVAGERLRAALAAWLTADRRLISLLLPDCRSLWLLPPLLTYIRIARAAGAAAVIDRDRVRIENALREIISDDAVTVAPGEPPSLFYSTLAAASIEEAGLAGRFPMERMVDRVESMLAEQLSRQSANLLTDIVAATRLLRMHGRPIPDTIVLSEFVRRSTLASNPLPQQSLVELCELAELLGDREEAERLAPIVRSRLWEILQLNPRKEVLALLDGFVAAVRLGEHGSPVATAAALTITEIALRTADELEAVRLTLS